MAGLYFHIPFCSYKCSYCDFFSGNQLYLIDDYVKSLISELKVRNNYLNGVSIGSIYFGGGTPSLLSIKHFGVLFDFIYSNYIVEDGCEITIECNPENINELYVKELYHFGFNRISLGIQFLKDEVLTKFKRNHDKKQIILSLETINDSEIRNLSVDIIYAVPGITDGFLLSSLEQLIVYDIRHVSAYSLTIAKESQLFWKIKNGEFKELKESEFLVQYDIVRNFLILHGFAHYEISNYAKPGFTSKHNLGYWNQIPYMGIGVSAHSFNLVSRQWNTKNIKKYIRDLSNEKGILNFEYEELTDKKIYNEYVILKMRTFQGISGNYIKEKFGNIFYEHFLNKSQFLHSKGYFVCEGDLVIPREGDLLIADYLSQYLMI